MKLSELQEQVDACTSYEEKFNLLRPDVNYPPTERDYSRLFAQTVHSFLLYNISIKKWMYYNGKYWEIDDSCTNIKRTMKEFSLKLVEYFSVQHPENATEEIIDFIKDFGKATKRNTLIKDAIDVYTVTSQDFDNDTYLFNCSNGTLDLRYLAMHEHNRNDMITKYSPVIYDENAQSDILDNFMSSIFCDDQDLIDYVYRVLGYSLSGLTDEECFFVLYGKTTRNGKSTLMSTFTHLLGGNIDSGYANNIGVETLSQKKFLNGSSPSPDVAKLKGARFVTCSEPRKNFVIDAAMVKTITGGDPISARMLYSNQITFKPAFKLFIATNHRLILNDDSVLESHRLRVIPFNRHFEDDEQDKQLKINLQAPEVQSALLAKCIKGLTEYYGHGLTEPQAVRDATSMYQTLSQQIQLFMDQCLIHNPSINMKMPDFYSLFVDWCDVNEIVPADKSDVLSLLRGMGIIKRHGTVNGNTFHNVICGYTPKDYSPYAQKTATIIQATVVPETTI